MIASLVSGGQTGVDRAALDEAIALNIPIGGWCPKGRRAEDGPLSERYPLKETPSDDYETRTEWNVRDSDGTLILNTGSLSGGTALTLTYAREHRKPYFIANIGGDGPIEDAVSGARAWLAENNIAVLNVAGPRLSKRPGIYAQSRNFLRSLLLPPSDD